ncbi:hypothetical protein [Aquibacillus albus]|uniref:YgiT-type zinc finger protein n=1 Tax=Aquibacillus albus TaxID=1168171 RepID=A0ABS2N0W2_9BACI|nr:hypothetical protein [Aquibacillus albus]MBM7571683.1 hypothetical protein [Aquibacillus albus]
MGAADVMSQAEQIQDLKKKYGQVKRCVCCGNWAIPSDDTLYEKMENGVTVELRNFPVFQCLNCEDITFSPADYSQLLEKALEYNKGVNVISFNCKSQL